MFLGTQYYWPEHPKKEKWERDIALIRDSGLEIIRVWLLWRKVNPSKGVWDWDDYDELFGLAEKSGLKVLIQLTPIAPRWLEKLQPRGTEEHGRSGEYVFNSGNPADFDNPAARANAEVFMKKVAERYRNHPSLFGYDLWNEPGEVSEIAGEHAQNKFRAFLAAKYVDISQYNRIWNENWNDFDEILVNQTVGGSNYVDYYEFAQWTQTEEMKWRYDTVRSVDNTHPLASHGHGHGAYTLFPHHDPWYFGEILDAWGCGLYLKTLHDALISFHSTACASSGKEWWLSEQLGGLQWSHVGEALLTDNFIRSTFIMAMSFDAGGILYWQWAPETNTGNPSQFGLTGPDGRPTSRTETVKRLSGVLKRKKRVFDRMRFTEPRTAILWDQSALAFEENGQRQSESLSRDLLRDNFSGWHKALCEGSLMPDILNARIVAEYGIPESIRMLVAPMQLFDRSGLSGHLRSWVSAGGTLLTGPLFGLCDDFGFANNRVPPAWLGVKQRERLFPENINVEFVRPEYVSYPPIPASHFIEALELEDAEIAGAVGPEPVVAYRELGEGRIIYIGTLLGNRYDSETASQLREFVRETARTAGAMPAVLASAGCFLRCAQSGSDMVLFLTNPRKKPADVWLTFLDGEGTLVDLEDDKEIGRISRRAKSVCLSLASEDSRLLLLKTSD